LFLLELLDEVIDEEPTAAIIKTTAKMNQNKISERFMTVFPLLNSKCLSFY